MVITWSKKYNSSNTYCDTNNDYEWIMILIMNIHVTIVIVIIKNDVIIITILTILKNINNKTIINMVIILKKKKKTIIVITITIKIILKITMINNECSKG